MNIIALKADKRKIFGRKVKTLRKENLLPANVYGQKVKSEALQISMDDFKTTYKDAGETGLIELTVAGTKKPVLIHNVQVNPVTDEPIHVDFLQVDLKQKVTTTIPVELSGESPAEKTGVGTVVQQLQEVEVEALPADLPEKFEVAIDNLSEVDQAILVKDLNYDKEKVEIKSDLEAIVAKVEPPQKEEVVVAPVPEAAEGEALAEGEAPAEGETTEEAPEEKPSEEGKSEA